VSTVFLIVVLYVFCAAAIAGQIKRRTGMMWYENALGFFGVTLWPITWAGVVVWRLVIRPAEPLVRGVYRINAGQTFFPEDE